MVSVAPRLDIAKNIQGWMSDGELHFLAETAAKSSGILEIGSYMGRSTRAIADNSSKYAIIDCVDPWDFHISGAISVTMQTYSLFRNNLHEHLNSGKVKPHRMTFEKFDPDYKYDFIFIDGDHHEKNVRHDIKKALEYLNPRGTLAGHDYHPIWPDVIKVVDEFFPNKNVVETIWWIQKS